MHRVLKNAHNMDMKRNYLLTVAILFISSMILLFSSTHVFDERSAKPVFSERKTEQILQKRILPTMYLPHVYKKFFSQFAP